MANTKGNTYPLWYIGTDQAVYAIDTAGKSHQMSNEGFAMDISVSEDGTVWILSTTPDPDGGGARIYWSNGNNNWNEIATSDPGGVQISGAAGSNCIYITSTDEVYTLTTAGKATKDFSDLSILQITYGGGYLWAIMPEKPGGVPVLRFLKASDATKQWTTFQGDVMPANICAAYTGTCGGTVNNNALYFSPDGQSSGSLGAGLDGQALQVSYRTWTYALSTQADSDGNLIYSWVNEGGGTFEQTSARGARIAASYFEKS